MTMVTSAPWLWRSTEGDPVHARLRHWVCVPKRGYLWVPEDAVTFTPALLSRVYGDGRALISLATCNQRPQYYIIRIDSAWECGVDMHAPPGSPELVEFLDDIYGALEEEFGECEADQDEDDPDIIENGYPWPAFDGRDGCAWSRMKWPPLLGLTFEPHPFSWRGNLLAPNNGRGT